MIKILLLSGALLALPLRAAILPLSPDAQAYADSLTGLTFCYPALQRPPYLEAEGGLLIDRLTRLQSCCRYRCASRSGRAGQP